MSDVKPFKGLRYAHNLDDIARLICPPYDVISSSKEKELRDASPFNYVRIEYSQDRLGDDASNNKFSRAANYLSGWIADKIITQDQNPAYYLHERTFRYENNEYKRTELFAAVRLEEWEKMVVRPHERTMEGPKVDRIKLINTLQANTSPVYCLYADPDKEIHCTISKAILKCDPIQFRSEEGDLHRFWCLNDSETARKLMGLFRSINLYIADGHHRYESALAYRNQWRENNPGYSGDEPPNFVLMALTDMRDTGLLILPTHRLIRGIEPNSISGLSDDLEKYFSIIKITLDSVGSTLSSAETNDIDDATFYIYGLKPQELWVLKKKEPQLLEELMPVGHTDVYRRLDVSIVDHIVLEHLLNLDASDEQLIAYDHDRKSAIERVDSGEFQFAFLLKPVPPETIISIADSCDRMPRKSTYFYPKIPSGLVIHLLTDK
jgi:uncharacterized protein (DUF1015 family)